MTAVVFHSWSTSHLRIRTFDEKTGTVIATANTPFEFGTWEPSQRYYLENFKEACDAPVPAQGAKAGRDVLDDGRPGGLRPGERRAEWVTCGGMWSERWSASRCTPCVCAADRCDDGR